jgi:uncharacterized membrane protein
MIIANWWAEYPAVITLIIMLGVIVVVLASLGITFIVWIATKIKAQKINNKKLKKEIQNELVIE